VCFFFTDLCLRYILLPAVFVILPPKADEGLFFPKRCLQSADFGPDFPPRSPWVFAPPFSYNRGAGGEVTIFSRIFSDVGPVTPPPFHSNQTPVAFSHPLRTDYRFRWFFALPHPRRFQQSLLTMPSHVRVTTLTDFLSRNVLPCTDPV